MVLGTGIGIAVAAIQASTAAYEISAERLNLTDKAAKEIKTLIQNSTAQVENGVRLVHGTGETLLEIGGLIETINEHMNAIADFTRDQASKLRDIGGAVDSLDIGTQQNAEVSEQSSNEPAVWPPRPDR
jgi:methyl-accepting chemotaxis protein